MKKILNYINNIDFTRIGLICFFVLYYLVSFVFLYFDFSPIIKVFFVINNYIFITGFLLSDLLGLNFNNDKWFYIVVSIGLSLTFIIFLGVVLNFVLPLFSLYKPLSSVNILITFSIINLFLGVRFIFKNVKNKIKLNISVDYNFLLSILPLLFIVLSIFGIILLNNVGDNNLILTLVPSVSFYCVYLLLTKKIINDSVYISTIFFISLSLILTFSFRGVNIVGWDINEEFQVFNKTLSNLRWSMEYYKGLDYNACLSITILPTIFKVLTGLPSQYVFKFFMQIFLAFIPVVVYIFSRKYINSKLSFVVSLVFISQTWFFEQMPAIIRQEIALLFYSVFILVLFRDDLQSKIKNILLALFVLSIVASHYTTSYILLSVLSGLYFIIFVLNYFIDEKIDRKYIISIFFIIFSILFWQVYITKTGDAFNKFISLNERKGADYIGVTEEDLKVSNKSYKQSGQNSLDDLKNNLLKEPSELREVYIDIVSQYIIDQDVTKYSNKDAVKFIPESLDDTTYNNSVIPKFYKKYIDFVSKTLKILFYILFPICGLLFFIKTNKDKQSREFAIFNMLGISLVSLMILIPYLQIHYNFTRLFLQIFISFSIFLGYFLSYFINRYKIFEKLLYILVVLMLIFNTGYLDQFIGGYKRMTMNTIPSDHYSYFIHTTEIMGAKWLGERIGSDNIVQADSMANLRLQSFGDTNAYNSKIFPLSIYKKAFVYMTEMNIKNGISYLQYKNRTIKYRYPIEFLDLNKNLIYANSGSRVYK